MGEVRILEQRGLQVVESDLTQLPPQEAPPNDPFEIPPDDLTGKDLESAPPEKPRRGKADKTGRFSTAPKAPKALPTKDPKVVAKKESKPKKKKAPKPGEAGHNAQAMDADAAFVSFLWDITALDRDIESTRGRRRNRFKQAQTDGVDTKAAVKVMKEMKLSGDEIIDELNRLNSYRGVVGLPASAQIRPESSMTAEKEVLNLAEVEGRRAAYRGAGSSTNPHEPGSPAGQRWLSGFQDASAIVSRAVKPAVITKVTAEAK